MTETSRVFVDSNVWLYALSDEDDDKHDRATDLIEHNRKRICLTVQVINEVCANLKRKSRMDESEIRYLISSFYLNYSILPLKEEILLPASKLRSRHSFSFWDSLIVARALDADAGVLYSEDMQAGFNLEDRLKIVNPFST